MNAYAAFDIETVFSPADLFANFGALATTIITVLVSFAGALSIIFIIIAGGPRINNDLAIELGFDAGFGPGTLPSHVASYVANKMVERKGAQS